MFLPMQPRAPAEKARKADWRSLASSLSQRSGMKDSASGNMLSSRWATCADMDTVVGL